MDLFLEWLRDNPILAQALASLVLAGLTIVLVVANVFLVWVGIKTVRTMRKDLEFRARPILSLKLLKGTEQPPLTPIMAALSVSHAHAELLELSAEFAYQIEPGNRQAKEMLNFNVHGFVIGAEDARMFRTAVMATGITEHSWVATVRYKDAIGLREYKQRFTSTYGEMIPGQETHGVSTTLSKFLPWTRR